MFDIIVCNVVITSAEGEMWVDLGRKNNNKTPQTCDIRGTLVGNKIVYHSDVVGALPVGAAPTTSAFLTYHLASIDCVKTTARQDKNHLSFGVWCDLYQRFDGISVWAFQM